jgi:hypothetical protein
MENGAAESPAQCFEAVTGISGMEIAGKKDKGD